MDPIAKFTCVEMDSFDGGFSLGDDFDDDDLGDSLRGGGLYGAGKGGGGGRQKSRTTAADDPYNFDLDDEGDDFIGEDFGGLGASGAGQRPRDDADGTFGLGFDFGRGPPASDEPAGRRRQPASPGSKATGVRPSAALGRASAVLGKYSSPPSRSGDRWDRPASSPAGKQHAGRAKRQPEAMTLDDFLNESDSDGEEGEGGHAAAPAGSTARWRATTDQPSSPGTGGRAPAASGESPARRSPPSEPASPALDTQPSGASGAGGHAPLTIPPSMGNIVSVGDLLGGGGEEVVEEGGASHGSGGGGPAAEPAYAPKPGPGNMPRWQEGPATEADTAGGGEEALSPLRPDHRSTPFAESAHEISAEEVEDDSRDAGEPGPAPGARTRAAPRTVGASLSRTSSATGEDSYVEDFEEEESVVSARRDQQGPRGEGGPPAPAPAPTPLHHEETVDYSLDDFESTTEATRGDPSAAPDRGEASGGPANVLSPLTRPRASAASRLVSEEGEGQRPAASGISAWPRAEEAQGQQPSLSATAPAPVTAAPSVAGGRRGVQQGTGSGTVATAPAAEKPSSAPIPIQGAAATAEAVAAPSAASAASTMPADWRAATAPPVPASHSQPYATAAARHPEPKPGGQQPQQPQPQPQQPYPPPPQPQQPQPHPQQPAPPPQQPQPQSGFAPPHYGQGYSTAGYPYPYPPPPGQYPPGPYPYPSGPGQYPPAPGQYPPGPGPYPHGPFSSWGWGHGAPGPWQAAYAAPQALGWTRGPWASDMDRGGSTMDRGLFTALLAEAMSQVRAERGVTESERGAESPEAATAAAGTESGDAAADPAFSVRLSSIRRSVGRSLGATGRIPLFRSGSTVRRGRRGPTREEDDFDATGQGEEAGTAGVEGAEAATGAEPERAAAATASTRRAGPGPEAEAAVPPGPGAPPTGRGHAEAGAHHPAGAPPWRRQGPTQEAEGACGRCPGRHPTPHGRCPPRAARPRAALRKFNSSVATANIMFREQLRMIQAQLLSSESQYAYALRSTGLESPGAGGGGRDPYTTLRDTEEVRCTRRAVAVGCSRR